MTHQERHHSMGIHGLHEHESAHNIQRISMYKKFIRLSLIVLLLLLLAMAAIFVKRHFEARALQQITQEAAVTQVNFVKPVMEKAQKTLELPGTLQGFSETSIYARVNGYVKKWHKDIGDSVKAGDLLATIDVPEVQQQLEEARANREQSANTLELARVSYERWKAMRERDAVSQQEFDERANAWRVAKANFAAAQAVVLRLERLVQFSQVEAPFDGVVTKRNIDVGSLVDSGNGGSPKLLFNLSQSKVLRLYVAVPQMFSASVKTGDAADIRLAEMPGKVFEGKVVRMATAIDPVSRTMQVEINLPNDKQVLMPGSYVTVTLKIKGSSSALTLTVPNNALLFRPEGVFVASVADDKIKLKRVKLGRDLGQSIQIIEGINDQDRVVINPPDAVLDGAPVVATAYEKPPAPGDAKPGETKAAEGKPQDGKAAETKSAPAARP
jgi:RND family efflux transporter MFP subunit